MADIKTMTQEIADLSIDIEDSMIDGDYESVVKILKKMIEKLDEITENINNN